MASKPTIAQAWLGLTPTLDGSTGAIQRQMAGPQMRAAGVKGGTVMGAGMLAAAKKFVAPLAAVFAVSEGFGFAKSAVAEASDLDESLNALQVTYGDVADGIAEIGRGAAQNLGLSNVELNAMAVQFSAFSKTIAGDGGDVVRTFDTISGRAADFASVMNLEVSEAALLFQSGLAGETEPLRRYGIDLSAATVTAYAYASGIAGVGEKLTEGQKVQARFASLMEQTAAVQGDFANTSDGLANQQRILGAQWDNFKAQLGKALLPLVTKFVGWLSDLIPVLTDVGERVRDFFSGVDDGGQAHEILRSFLDMARERGQALADGFRQHILPALKQLWASFQEDILPVLREWVAIFRESVLPHLQEFAAWINEHVVPAVAKFVGWLLEATAAYWKHVGPALLAMTAFFRDKVIPAISDTIRRIQNLVRWFRDLPGNIKAAVANVAERIAAPFRAGFELVTGWRDSLVQWFRDLPGNIGSAMSGVRDTILAPFKAAFNGIASAWNRGPGRLQFTVPDWVPLIGNESWGFPKIPLLAEGGIVTRPTLIMAGEGRGPEAVLPLDRLDDLILGADRTGRGNTWNIYEQSDPVATAYKVLALLDARAAV